jgi:polyribonucleotide nucleotidyltransferase
MAMKRYEIQVGRAPITIETGRMAKQADGATVIRMGDTVVFVAAGAAKEPKPGIDFLPLTVDYRENNFAAGKIPGGFFKREGRQNEKEILTCRQIDRPLRPLFPEGWGCETQISALLWSADLENESDTLALIGASASLCISDIPFDTPVGAVRVGFWDGQCHINPTSTEMKTKSELNLLVAGTEKAICMVESSARELSEDDMVRALVAGHEAIKVICAVQRQMMAEVGKVKRQAPKKEIDHALAHEIAAALEPPLYEAMQKRDKLEMYAKMDAVKKAYVATLTEEQAAKKALVSTVYDQLREHILRREILERGRRLDGRRFDEIRPITSEVTVLPRTHGSALFTRGETQALVTATLGTSEDAQIIDTVQELEHKKRFMLHYNFPSFSVGEVRPNRGPGRREIGHGALAERALREMLPSEEDFPYTIRIVSDILESNGSSSMASICGGTLSMLDAGVPLKAPVAGVAMGLVSNGEKYVVLSDIAGEEDHYGDMDFKVAGTAKGLTALQMDIKIDGLPADLLARALAQAREGRLHILGKMAETLTTHRTEMSVYAPRIITVRISVDKIRDVIGPGGKMIRSITERTGCKIEIEDDGRVLIASTDLQAAQQAVAIIEELTASVELGKTYMGKVVRIVDFGAFVEIMPGTDGLLHVSEIAHERVNEVRDVLAEGDTVMVKVLTIDPMGKVRLSKKALIPLPEGMVAPPEGSSDRPPRREGGGDRDRGRGGDRPRGGGGGGRGGGFSGNRGGR